MAESAFSQSVYTQRGPVWDALLQAGQQVNARSCTCKYFQTHATEEFQIFGVYKGFLSLDIQSFVAVETMDIQRCRIYIFFYLNH